MTHVTDQHRFPKYFPWGFYRGFCEMTRYPSHPSPPWPGARKPRAASPRTAHDYNLLAATVACWGAPVGMISCKLGFEEDYAERLLRSGSGHAFTEWLRQQPEEFISQFLVDIGGEPDTDAPPGAGQSPDPGPESRTAMVEKALAQFGFTSGQREDR